MDIEKAIDIAKSLCVQFEGLYLRPYLCPAGVPTIGYGSTFYDDGRKVRLTDQSITRYKADQLLDFMLRTKFMPAVIKLCPGLETESQLGAITDFAFNLGINALKNSTLRKKINAGDWVSAKKEILKWNKAGGKELEGLKKRRLAESLMM